MAVQQLPPISTISTLSATDRAAILDCLFEPCEQLHTLSVELLRTQTFIGYGDLVASIGVQLTDLLESSSTSDAQWLDEILCAHPRLGAQKVESAQSKAEQAQLQGQGPEAVQLNVLNEEYERKFPGLRYV